MENSPTDSSFARIAAENLDAQSAYRMLTGFIVPRPIAWITTVNENDGMVNLAPFSAFTMVSNDPPMVGINIGLRNGIRKDTARNIDANGEFVVNIPPWHLRNEVHDSGQAHPNDISEAELLGLATTASHSVKPPRLTQAPASMECVLSERVVFGRAGAEFTVGEVIMFHVRDDLISNGKVDTRRLDPLARLAGPTYSQIGHVEHLAGFSSQVDGAGTARR